MTKRRLLIALAVPVLLAGALLAWCLWPGHGITEENIARIETGMTRAEVEELLGAPPGEYDGASAADSLFLDFHWGDDPVENGLTPREWVSRGGAVRVYFDADGRVARIASGVAGREETWWEEQLVRLGLRQPRGAVYPIYRR